MKSVAHPITVLSAAVAVFAPVTCAAQYYRPTNTYRPAYSAPVYRPILPSYSAPAYRPSVRIANPIVIVPRQNLINTQNLATLQNAVRQQAAIQQLATQV